MVTINTCTRKNLCVDCNNRKCLGAGDKGADCPKYHCDNPKGAFECADCEFIDGYVEQMREMTE